MGQKEQTGSANVTPSVSPSEDADMDNVGNMAWEWMSPSRPAGRQQLTPTVTIKRESSEEHTATEV